MELCYQVISGREYAKIPGRSVRKNGKICKEDVVYLGRVIDKEHHIFYNRERGIFSYNPDTNEYGTAPETYRSDEKADLRKKQKRILDFGDAYFIDSVLKNIGYTDVLRKIPYQNKDTLYSMVLYYILCNSANDHAKIWFEGSFTSAMYPKANLISQRISDFLSSLGKPDTLSAFFDAHIEWIKTQCGDPAVLIDSTGLPNNIHFPLTAVSNHGGKISREVRLTTLVQRDSGYPLLFRTVPGNIIDLSTVTRTLNELFMRDMSADFVIMDAGYFTNENVEELYGANIEFLTRLSSKYTLYKQIVKEHLPSLKQKQNLVEYKGRYVYIKRIDCRIGYKEHPAYAYLGYDIDRASDESHKALKRANKEKTSASGLHDTLQEAGLFMIVSTLPFSEDDILPAYYTRQLIEQYFDISKGSSKMTPLRVHSEEAMNGHLMLSMIAATINVYIQNKTGKIYDDREEIFMTLRNQKCSMYQTRITTTEPQKQANAFYKLFDVKCPLYFDINGNELKSQFHLPKINPDDT